MHFSASFKVLAAGLVLAACANDRDQGPSSASALVSGTTIDSPNADPKAVYRGARSVANLNSLGALGDSAIASLVTKVDQNHDGSYSIEELLAVEQPTSLVHLLPPERAALPQLWQWLATASGDPLVPTIAAPFDMAITDTSTPATALQPPANIALATLSDALQRVAAHVEAIHDDDQSPATISPSDIAAVTAAPAGFQPWELSQLDLIGALFTQQSTTTLGKAALVATHVDVTTKKIVPLDPAAISLRNGLEYFEHRTFNTHTGDLVVSLRAHVTHSPTVTVPDGTTVIILDESTPNESFLATGPTSIAAGTRTLEVWNAGQRTSVSRVTFPDLRSTDQDIDLSPWIDYVLSDSGGVLNKYATTGTVTTDAAGTATYDVAFKFETGSGSNVPSATIVAGVATPAFGVPAGRYVAGDVTLELAPTGALVVTRGPFTGHAIVRGNQFVLPSNAGVAMSYDPSTNALSLADSSGVAIFDGILTSDARQN